jgi:hypothetical protein
MPMKKAALYLIVVVALAAGLVIFKQLTVSNTRYQEVDVPRDVGGRRSAQGKFTQ